MNPETAEWLDGPKFVAWMKKHGLLKHLTTSQKRRISVWNHEGAKANIYLVDQMLVRASQHLTDLPDALYTSPPPRRMQQQGNVKRAASAERRRQRIATLWLRGLPVHQIAQALAIAPGTVRNHLAMASKDGTLSRLKEKANEGRTNGRRRNSQDTSM